MLQNISIFIKLSRFSKKNKNIEEILRIFFDTHNIKKLYLIT